MTSDKPEKRDAAGRLWVSEPVELALTPETACRLALGDRRRFNLNGRPFLAHGCDGSTSNPAGDCLRNGRHVLARYGADQACGACIAALALGVVDSAGNYIATVEMVS